MKPKEFFKKLLFKKKGKIFYYDDGVLDVGISLKKDHFELELRLCDPFSDRDEFCSMYFMGITDGEFRASARPPWKSVYDYDCWYSEVRDCIFEKILFWFDNHSAMLSYFYEIFRDDCTGTNRKWWNPFVKKIRIDEAPGKIHVMSLLLYHMKEWELSRQYLGQYIEYASAENGMYLFDEFGYSRDRKHMDFLNQVIGE